MGLPLTGCPGNWRCGWRDPGGCVGNASDVAPSLSSAARRVLQAHARTASRLISPCSAPLVASVGAVSGDPHLGSPYVCRAALTRAVPQLALRQRTPENRAPDCAPEVSRGGVCARKQRSPSASRMIQIASATTLPAPLVAPLAIRSLRVDQHGSERETEADHCCDPTNRANPPRVCPVGPRLLD